MKLKSLITFALLFVLGFSMVHEYAFAFEKEEHCSVVEFVHELDAPSNHGDICDIHFEYHQSFLLAQNANLPKIEPSILELHNDKETYTFEIDSNFLKPPIS